jgi:hypothetical protein
MAGYYADAEKYQISSWFLGCLEKEIDSHIEAERERILKDLTDLADRFNTSTPSSHWIRDLYRFIETEFARTHENSANPRFVDAEILDFRTNARKETND